MNPHNRYAIMIHTSFLSFTLIFKNRPAADPDVAAARRAIMSDGPVPMILDSQNPDGSWGIPQRFYTDKYTGTVWTLLILAELSADLEDPRVRKACEFILRQAQNPETAGFSIESSARTGTGLASGVIPCLTGNRVYSLIKLGYLADDRVRRGIDWIVRWQRADDASESKPADPMYQRYEMCWGRHSCHMGVAKTMKALAAVPPDRRDDGMNAKLDQLAEYFLIHHLYKKSHNLDEISKPGWLRPGFPLMYQTDILELLGVFASLKRWDPRLQEALDRIKNKRQADGTWIMEQSNNGKMLVRIEQKGKSSKWLTLKALEVLQAFGS